MCFSCLGQTIVCHTFSNFYFNHFFHFWYGTHHDFFRNFERNVPTSVMNIKKSMRWTTEQTKNGLSKRIGKAFSRHDCIPIFSAQDSVQISDEGNVYLCTFHSLQKYFYFPLLAIVKNNIALTSLYFRSNRFNFMTLIVHKSMSMIVYALEVQ